MGFNAIKIKAADAKVTNLSAGHYVSALQVSAQRCFLYKLTVSVPVAVAADAKVWVFDTAAGSGASAGPDLVFTVPFGATATLDFADGSLYQSGLYVVIATNEPANGATTPTAAAADTALLRAEYRNE